jgi:hypothetical protein
LDYDQYCSYFIDYIFPDLATVYMFTLASVSF